MLFGLIARITGRKVELEFQDWRQGDQRWYVSDISAATQALGLGRPLPWRRGIESLAEWLASERAAEPQPEPAFASTAE